MSKPSGKSMSLRKKLLLGLIPALLLFGLAEIGSRLYAWKAYGRHDRGMHWSFEYEPYLLVKTKGRIYQEFPIRENQFRVLVLGGSTAVQIRDEDLRRVIQPHTDREVVIMNLANGGYIINQEKIMLVLYGMRLKPDLLITLDGANDFVSASKVHKPGIIYHDAFVAYGVDHPILNAVFSVCKKSQFFNSLNKLRERRIEKGFQAKTELKQRTIDHVLEGWYTLSQIAQGMEIPYLMVLQPYLHLKDAQTAREETIARQYDYRIDYLTTMFHDTSARMGSTRFAGKTYAMDASTFFDEAPGVEIFTDEAHLTQEGIDILVERILAIALERGFTFPEAPLPETVEP